MTASEHSIAMVRAAARAAADKQANDIVALDVSDRLAITDAFVITSATNERQVNAIVDGIEEALAELGEKPVRREGRSGGRWVLLDYVTLIVHVQHEEDRVFYALERLWNDSPVIDVTAEIEAKAGTPLGAERSGGLPSNVEPLVDPAELGLSSTPSPSDAQSDAESGAGSAGDDESRA